MDESMGGEEERGKGWKFGRGKEMGGMLWKWRGKRGKFEKERDRKRGDEVWERERGNIILRGKDREEGMKLLRGKERE